MDTGIYRIMQAKMGLEGLEPPTYCLEGSCSIQMSYWRVWSGRRESNPHIQLGRLVFCH